MGGTLRAPKTRRISSCRHANFRSADSCSALGTLYMGGTSLGAFSRTALMVVSH